MKSFECISGINVTTLSLEDIIRVTCRYIDEEEKKKIVYCVNPHSVVLAQNDTFFADGLNNADITLPDGIGIVLYSKMNGGSIKKRISGPDFFIRFSDFINKNNKGYRYFFFGGTKEVLSNIQRNLEEEYPNITISGIYAPPFGEWSEEEDKKIIELINKSISNILWVGLGAPKQENWITKNKHLLNINVIGAIGAGFDFYSGTKKRCPKIFRNLGLEWFYRFMLEPKRLWRRNLISTPKFLILYAKSILLKNSRK